MAPTTIYYYTGSTKVVSSHNTGHILTNKVLFNNNMTCSLEANAYFDSDMSWRELLYPIWDTHLFFIHNFSDNYHLITILNRSVRSENLPIYIFQC